MSFTNNNSVNIKLIEKTRIFFFKQNIFISGPRGLIVYKKLLNYQNFTFILSKKNLFCFQKDKASILNNSVRLYNLLNTLICTVHYFFSKKLVLVGIGIRAWVKHFEKNKILLIKIGFSRDLYIQIPKNLIVLSLRPTLLLVRGLNKEAVSLFSAFIRRLKTPDVYKGKGIFYQNESSLLKPGKKS